MSTGEIGLFVSISSRWVTSNVTEESTGIEYAEASTIISGGRFRIVIFSSIVSVSLSPSVIIKRTRYSPSSSHTKSCIQSSSSIISIFPEVDSISNTHSTAPPSGSIEFDASRVAVSYV